MSYFEENEEYRLGDPLEDEDEECIDKYNRKVKYSFQMLSERWVNRDGYSICIERMDKKYLFNVKNMIERSCKEELWNPFEYSIYKNILKELLKRYE